MSLGIPVEKERIAEFCQRHHIRKLSLFGSVLRDDFGPDSDVDVLVEFDPEQRVGFFKLFEIEQELSELLDGRKVDMVTYGSLNRHLRDLVITSSEVQYAER